MPPGTGLSYQLHNEHSDCAILYLHGFLGCKEDWNEITGQIGDDYAHLMIDLPGHGASLQLPGDSYTMGGCTRLLVNLLDNLGLDNCDVVGYSMGGRLALYLAVQYPRFFNRFVIESASPGLKTEEERTKRTLQDRHLAGSLVTGGFEEFLISWYNQPLFEAMDRNSDAFAELLERRRKSNPKELARSLRAMGTGVQPSLWEQLKQVRTPILFVVGEKDAKFRGLADQMTCLCAGCKVAIIPEVGHNVHFEQPTAFCDRVSRFLAR